MGGAKQWKTTFLAALGIALTKWGKGWNVVGADEALNKLISLTTPLTHEHAFPLATSGIEGFRWLLVGRVTRTISRWFRTERYEETVKIFLDLADPSGEIAGPSRADRGERGPIDNL